MSVPKDVVTNQRLIDNYLMDKDITPEKIRRMVGISERRFVSGESLADMALESIAGLEIDTSVNALFYVGNTVPDGFCAGKTILTTQDSEEDPLSSMPEVWLVISRLENHNSYFREMTLHASHGGCAHFIKALGNAYHMIQTGKIDNAVVVTSTDISLHIDWADKSTALLFGDGACAAFLKKGDAHPSIQSYYEGRRHDLDNLLYYEKVGNRWLTRMPEGLKVANSAVEAVGACVENLKKDEIYGQINLFVLHQANGRLIDIAARKHSIPLEKVYKIADRYGNTASASAGMALCDAVKTGTIKEGYKVAVISFGAGFQYNCMTLQF
jgi:3-oxoacyl-[acyl-carrier-protein] synthase-3